LVLLALRRVAGALDLFTAPSTAAMLGFVALGTLASLLAALILYWLLERPLLRASRRLLPRRA
ncbi:MAG: hypothetical protein WBF53_14615, partial [Litorimonas sp.]